jgi:hypothetical protein
MRATDYSEVDPGTAYSAAEALTHGQPVHLWLEGVPTPVLMMPVDTGAEVLMYLATKGACVAVTHSTAFNAFELVRGGFRLDIATRLVVLLSALQSSVNRVTDTQAAGLLEAHGKAGD